MILSGLAYTRAISAAAFRVAIVRWIIGANFPRRALNTGDAPTCLLFSFSAFALILHRNSRPRRSARVSIGFPITSTNWAEFPGANDGLSLAHPLRVGNFAFAGTKIAVLLCVRTCCAGDATTGKWHIGVDWLAPIGEFHVEEGPRLGTDFAQLADETGKALWCRAEAGFCARNQPALDRDRSAHLGTIDGERIHRVNGDRMADQLPYGAQGGVIQCHPATAQVDIHSTIRRIAPALATLRKSRPGREEEYADQDKPENFIHSHSHFGTDNYALELCDMELAKIVLELFLKYR